MSRDHAGRRAGARVATLAAAVVAAVTFNATPAFAHATANPGEAEAGSYQVIKFRIGHACEGSPTTGITIRMPDGVASVSPEFMPDWGIETKRRGRTVRFTGGPSIPDHRYFEWGISMQMPDRPGETLYFPTIQQCEEGEIGWIQIPEEGEDAHELEEPAPAVTLVASEGGHGSGSAGAQQGEPQAASDGTGVAGDQPARGIEPWTLAALIVAVLGLLAAAGAFVTARRLTA